MTILVWYRKFRAHLQTTKFWGVPELTFSQNIGVKLGFNRYTKSQKGLRLGGAFLNDYQESLSFDRPPQIQPNLN